jgi:adenylate cyclase
VTGSRRLAAIMFTDMVGSTAAAQTNEPEALRLRDEQQNILRHLFAAHQGREIKSMGDGFLAEFDSALRAVQCAIDIQQQLHERNSGVATPPIQMRIGIHLGDVEQREADIYGDAVNIASRIEPLATPGGVCISGEVFSQVRNKVSNRLEKLPPTPLKGLQVVLDVYRVVLPWTARDSTSAGQGPSGIAVLPFTNISPDPSDAYFADGLTEELITVLSRVRDLRVISRTSVTQYRSTTKSVVQIGTELGVATVLEGSVRKAGKQLRITAQLIDAQSDKHLWANTYDRELDNVFAVQTEIARQVASALQVELRPVERASLERRPAVDAESYLAFLRGRVLSRTWSHETLSAAKREFERAIVLDGRNAPAYAGLALATYLVGLWFSAATDTAWVEETLKAAERAIEIDPDLSDAHLALAYVRWRERDNVAAEREFRLALSLNPSHSQAHQAFAMFLEDHGRTDEALVEFLLAEGSDPLWHTPLFFHGFTLVWLSRLDEALPVIERYIELAPKKSRGSFLLASYFRARGDLDAALKELHGDLEEREPQESPIVRAYILALSGKKQEARELLRDPSVMPEYGQNAYLLSRAYAELGDLDECFRWMEYARERRNLPIQAFRLDPLLEPVRQDPRFREILGLMNLA